VIFADSSLKDMCAKLPQTNEEFLMVNGVGENKLQKYGEVFIQAISTFLATHPDREKGLMTEEVPKKVPKKAPKRVVGDTHLETLKWYQENLSVTEIAEKRQLSISTIENHLLLCAKQGLGVDFNTLIPAEYIPLLEKAVGEAGRNTLKPIKELLPDEVSYFMIKGYLYFLSKESVNS
jgi:ATP-dependent DNA helicase RecQ